MAEYVNKEEVLEHCEALPKLYREAMRLFIKEIPSVNIVRCQDCKYWEESQYYQEFMVCTYIKGATFTRQHDDFCSRGERKGIE